jgi:hypothetical protein
MSPVDQPFFPMRLFYQNQPMRSTVIFSCEMGANAFIEKFPAEDLRGAEQLC